MMIRIITGNLCCVQHKTRTAEVTTCILSERQSDRPRQIPHASVWGRTATQWGSKHHREIRLPGPPRHRERSPPLAEKFGKTNQAGPRSSLNQSPVHAGVTVIAARDAVWAPPLLNVPLAPYRARENLYRHRDGSILQTTCVRTEACVAHDPRVYKVVAFLAIGWLHLHKVSLHDPNRKPFRRRAKRRSHGVRSAGYRTTRSCAQVVLIFHQDKHNDTLRSKRWRARAVGAERDMGIPVCPLERPLLSTGPACLPQKQKVKRW